MLYNLFLVTLDSCVMLVFYVFPWGFLASLNLSKASRSKGIGWLASQPLWSLQTRIVRRELGHHHVIPCTVLKSHSFHFPAGVPLDLLEKDWWVPGVNSRAECAKFAGKQQWREILNPSGASVLLWATRLTKDYAFGWWLFDLVLYYWKMYFVWEDFERHVTTESTKKQKAGWGCIHCTCQSVCYVYTLRQGNMLVSSPVQKNQQLNEEGATMLHDVVCLWVWVKETMKMEFTAAVIEQHDEKFLKGTLGFEIVGCSQVGCDGLAAAKWGVMGWQPSGVWWVGCSQHTCDWSPRNPVTKFKQELAGAKLNDLHVLGLTFGLWLVPAKTRHYFKAMAWINQTNILNFKKSIWWKVAMPRGSSRVFAGTRHLSPCRVYLPTLIGFDCFFWI